MADSTDIAQSADQFYLETALANAKRTTLKPRGCCWNCEEMLPAQQNFCDRDCEDDYTKRSRNAPTHAS